jgi:hypothetical protein
MSHLYCLGCGVGVDQEPFLDTYTHCLVCMNKPVEMTWDAASARIRKNWINGEPSEEYRRKEGVRHG